MSKEPLSEELRTDAAALFYHLYESTEIDPSETPLEWVFATDCPFLVDEPALDMFFSALGKVVAAEEDDVRAEVHAYEQDESEFQDDEASQFLLIYTGILTQRELKKLHSNFQKAARRLGAEYLGVQYGLPGEADEANLAACMEMTKDLLKETARWKLSELEFYSETMRSRHIEVVTEMGLNVADWMPTAEVRGFTELRPKAEILRRAMAAFAAFAWVCAPDDDAPSSTIKAYVKENGLTRGTFSKREAEFLTTPRDDAREMMPQAGWISENIWGLVWILGNAPLVCPYDQFIPGEIFKHIREEFFQTFDRSFDDLMAVSDLRRVQLVTTLEDFYYCLHNGIRTRVVSESGGEREVEVSGLIHERRHPLTWALSPGVDWDATDLST